MSLAIKNEHPTVYILDDDADLREALALLIEAAGYKAASFADAQSFLSTYANQPGCLVLDLTMPGCSGLELQQALADKSYSIPIIFLTGQGSIPHSVQAIKAGAVDFLEKPVDYTILLQRISEALALDARQREESIWLLTLQQRFEQLTPREQEILILVVNGNTSKEIARILGISHRTVEVYRTRIMTKLQADSVPELVNWALLCGVGNKT